MEMARAAAAQGTTPEAAFRDIADRLALKRIFDPAEMPIAASFLRRKRPRSSPERCSWPTAADASRLPPEAHELRFGRAVVPTTSCGGPADRCTTNSLPIDGLRRHITAGNRKANGKSHAVVDGSS